MDYKELISTMEQLNKRILMIEQKLKQMQTALTLLDTEIELLKKS